MPPTARPRYHHGNLRAALIDAGLELARAGGPDAIVLREASRRVGVSHNAAYRHFPDREALLEAVAERCMAQLSELMEQMLAATPAADDPRTTAQARLRAVGTAYVRFALAEPGLFRTAFLPSGRHELPHGKGEDPLDPPSPYELLGAQLDELVAAGAMDPARRPGAETTAWAGVHGLSCLLLDGPLRALPDTEREAALQRLLLDLATGLSAPRPADAVSSGAARTGTG